MTQEHERSPRIGGISKNGEPIANSPFELLIEESSQTDRCNGPSASSFDNVNDTKERDADALALLQDHRQQTSTPSQRDVDLVAHKWCFKITKQNTNPSNVELFDFLCELTKMSIHIYDFPTTIKPMYLCLPTCTQGETSRGASCLHSCFRLR